MLLRMIGEIKVSRDRFRCVVVFLSFSTSRRCDLDGALGSRYFLNVANERTCFASRACAFKSSGWNALSTQKSYLCFCRVNESSEAAKRFWQYRDHLKVFRMMDFTAWP